MTDHRPLHHCRPPITHVRHPRYNASWVVVCCMWRWWVTMVASGVHQGGGECRSALTKYNASHLWTPQHHCHSLASKEFDGEWWIDDQCQCQLPRSVLTSPLKIDHYFDWQHWTANSSYIHEIRLSPPHVAIIHIILIPQELAASQSIIHKHTAISSALPAYPPWTWISFHAHWIKCSGILILSNLARSMQCPPRRDDSSSPHVYYVLYI